MLLEMEKKGVAQVEHNLANPLHLSYVVAQLGGQELLEMEAPHILKLLENQDCMKTGGGPAQGAEKKGNVDAFKDGVVINDTLVSDTQELDKLEGEVTIIGSFTELTTMDIKGTIRDLDHHGVPVGEIKGSVTNSYDYKDNFHSTLYTQGGLKDRHFDLLLQNFRLSRKDQGGYRFSSSTVRREYTIRLSDEPIKEFVYTAPASKPEHAQAKTIVVVYARKGNRPDWDHEYPYVYKTGSVNLWLPMEFLVTVKDGYRIVGLNKQEGYDLFVEGVDIVKHGGMISHYCTYPEDVKEQDTVYDTAGNKVKTKYIFPDNWDQYLTGTADIVTNQNFYFTAVLDVECIATKEINKIRLIYSSYGIINESKTVKPCKIIEIQWGCMAKGSMIHMADGTDVKIEELKPGDRAAVYGGQEAEIWDIYRGYEEWLYRITTNTGRKTVLTEDHPVIEPDLNPVKVSYLRPGDLLLTKNGVESVSSVEKVLYKDTVYNLKFQKDTLILCDGFVMGDLDIQQKQNGRKRDKLPAKVSRYKEMGELEREMVRLTYYFGKDQDIREFENILLHYFTVKLLAREAGFEEEEAQKIAEYCQFTGDNQEGGAVCTGDSVLTELIQQGLAQHKQEGWIVSYAPSGLGGRGWFDNNVKNEICQENILIPFHFFPPVKLDMKNKERYLTQPAPDFLKEYLEDTAVCYRKSLDQSQLPRIGIGAHILSDTFTHQGFSGLESWENRSCIKMAELKKDGRDITKEYQPALYYTYPNVGFANVNRILDDGGVQAELLYACTESEIRAWELSGKREVDNDERFIKAACSIYAFLCSCTGKDPDSEEDFNKKYKHIFTAAYNNGKKKLHECCQYWRQIYPAAEFHYEKEEIRARLEKGETSCNGIIRYEELFQFTLALDEFRRLPGKEASVTLRPPMFENNEIVLDVTAYTRETEKYKLNVTLQDLQTKVYLGNVEDGPSAGGARFDFPAFYMPMDTYIREDTRFYGLIVKTRIQEQDYNLYKTIRLDGVPNPAVRSFLDKPMGTNPLTDTVLVVNGAESLLADYCYPDNHEKNIYFPIRFKTKLKEVYLQSAGSVQSCSIRLVFEAAGRKWELPYCNEPEVRTEDGYLIVDFPADWNQKEEALPDRFIARLEGELVVRLPHNRFIMRKIELDASSLCYRKAEFQWRGEV